MPAHRISGGDRLREEVLTNLGWKVHRIWSLDWVRNRQGELERLETALERATVWAPDRLRAGVEAFFRAVAARG